MNREEIFNLTNQNYGCTNWDVLHWQYTYRPLYFVGLFGNHTSLIIKKSQSIDATVLYTSLEDILGQTEVYFT